MSGIKVIWLPDKELVPAERARLLRLLFGHRSEHPAESEKEQTDRQM